MNTVVIHQDRCVKDFSNAYYSENGRFFYIFMKYCQYNMTVKRCVNQYI